jgi:hypothetical protein
MALVVLLIPILLKDAQKTSGREPLEFSNGSRQGTPMEIEIFVSSTFKDFHTERDLFQNEIRQRLNSALRLSLGDSVAFIDLRWGIDTSSQRDDTAMLRKVLSVCIPSVLATKPFFILLLGDSYGSLTCSSLVQEILATYSIPLEGAISITEAEALASPLFSSDNGDCLLLRRHLVSVAPSYRALYCPKDNEEALERFSLRASSALAQHPENILDYEASVGEDGGLQLSNSESFIAFIVSKLTSFLAARFSELLHPDPSNLFKINSRLFEEYIATNQRLFCGREKETDAVLDNLKVSGQVYQGILGPSGSGKSAFLAHLVYRLRLNPKALVLPFFAQLSVGPNNASFLFDNLYLQALGEPIVPSLNAEASMARFAAYLQEQTKQGRFIYSVIDSIDDFVDLTRILRFTSDPTFKDNVRFIVSLGDEKGRDLPPLEFADSVRAMSKKLALFHKETSPYLLEVIKAAASARPLAYGNPAYLGLLSDSLISLNEETYMALASLRLRQGHSFDFDRELADLLAKKLAASAPSLKEEYLRRFQAASPEALALYDSLALAKGGLSLAELLILLKRPQLEILEALYRFPNEIILSANGRYRISHDLFKVTLQQFLPKDSHEHHAAAYEAFLLQSVLLGSTSLAALLDYAFDHNRLAVLEAVFEVPLEQGRARLLGEARTALRDFFAYKVERTLFFEEVESYLRFGPASLQQKKNFAHHLFFLALLSQEDEIIASSLPFFNATLSNAPNAIGLFVEPSSDLYVPCLLLASRCYLLNGRMEDYRRYLDLAAKEERVYALPLCTNLFYLTLQLNDCYFFSAEATAQLFGQSSWKQDPQEVAASLFSLGEKSGPTNADSLLSFGLNLLLQSFLLDSALRPLADQGFRVATFFLGLSESFPKLPYHATYQLAFKAFASLFADLRGDRDYVVNQIEPLAQELDHYPPSFKAMDLPVLLLSSLVLQQNAQRTSYSFAQLMALLNRTTVNFRVFQQLPFCENNPCLLSLVEKNLEFLGLGFMDSVNFERAVPFLVDYLKSASLLGQDSKACYGYLKASTLLLLYFWVGAYCAFSSAVSSKVKATYESTLTMFALFLPSHIQPSQNFPFGKWFAVERQNILKRVRPNPKVSVDEFSRYAETFLSHFK